MLIGYARVSTKDQNLDPQLDALTAAGCERIFSEKASGAKADRPELAKALDMMRAGDVLVVTKLDRLGRTSRQLINTVEDLRSKDMHFRCLDHHGIDTSSAMGKAFFSVFAAMAELERDLIRERTQTGLKAAVARGRRGGRPKALSEADYPTARALLADPKVPVRECARRLGVSVNTLYAHFPDGKKIGASS